MAKPKHPTKHDMAMGILSLYKAIDKKSGGTLSEVGYKVVYRHLMRLKATELAARLNDTRSAAKEWN